MFWYQSTSDIVPFDYDMRFSPEMTSQKIKKLVPKEYEIEIEAEIATGINIFDIMNECRIRFGPEKQRKNGEIGK